MSTAQFVSACSTLSDAQLQLLISSMDKPQLLKLLKSVNDPALTDRLKGPLIASGNESLVAIVIKDTTNQIREKATEVGGKAVNAALDFASGLFSKKKK